jgi:hypothetical protein
MTSTQRRVLLLLQLKLMQQEQLLLQHLHRLLLRLEVVALCQYMPPAPQRQMLLLVLLPSSCTSCPPWPPRMILSVCALLAGTGTGC